MNRRLDEISDQGHNQIAELRQLRTSTAALESSLGNWQQVPGLAEEVRAIVRQASDAIDRNARKQILKELWMQHRFEEVDEAHESTFDWILGNDDSSSEEDDGYHSEDTGHRSSPENDRSSSDDDKDDTGEDDGRDGETPEEAQARQKIVNWLINEHGIFHISGKPGSGKSTLMKLASRSSGLAIEDRPCQIHGRDVEAALTLVLDQSDLWAAHKVAFFIDRLDEFEGDHDHMMKLLLRWVREYKDSVKLCVSSREWEIFRQRLAGCPGIRLQDITVRDIKSYVSHELSENEEFERLALTSPEILGLVDQITTKAEGVFLWVKITLRGLKYGLLSGERFEDLEERINGLPTELEALYRSLFDSMMNGRHMNKLDRAKAMRTLLLALLYAHAEGEDHFRPPFMLISYSFLDEYTRDQDFAQKMDIQPVGKGVCDTRLDYARKLIYQRCMGFLETHMMHVKCYNDNDYLVAETRKSESTDVTQAQGNGMPSSGETGNDDSDDVSRSTISNVKVSSQISKDQGSIASSGQGKLAVEDGQESTASWHYAAYEGRADLVVDQINTSLYPVRHGIRFIHRTALEFLSQPWVSRQIRDAAAQFNEADFELQAIIASMKLFTPSARYAKDFITNLRHRLNHYLVRLGIIHEACFLSFQGEAARVLRHYDLATGYRLLFVSELIPHGQPNGEALLDPNDALLLLGARTGASQGLSSLTGHELTRKLRYDNPPKDVVLDSYLDGMYGYFDGESWSVPERTLSGEDQAAYGQRICRDVAAYLETGASPNSASHHALRREGASSTLTCWQLWLSFLLIWEDVEVLCERFLELFLLHKADTEIWFSFSSKTGRGLEIQGWWPALHKESFRISVSRGHTSKLVSFLRETEAEEHSEGRAMFLGDMLLILFPQTGARLKELADRNLGSGALPPPKEVWPSVDSRPSSTSGSSSSRSRRSWDDGQ
ncbi:hypothetical protein CPLU01_10872 [Colletotrichum plurivorum]|uniref:DUF7791 domain-containing protein n=1 Tax=Colletotrichum plurivorum TaxID=2175906 RepID=A0A8H6K539_9PEZI|nr:hypothetical protein CPLU01_10872 [Colletotrichum plurivorum]